MTQIEFSTSRSGAPTAVVLCTDGAARALYSRYDPAKQAVREAGAWDAAGASVVIVLGLGLGYHLEALAARLPESVKFIVFEKRPELAQAALERADFSALIQSGRLVLNVEFDNERAAAATIGPAAVFRHPALFDIDMDYYYPLLRAHTRALRPGGLRVLSFMLDGAAVPYSLMDSHAAFRALGHEVEVIDLRGFSRDQEQIDAVRKAAVSFAPDLIFTIDAVGLVPSLMRSLEIPIISWFFDNPFGFLKNKICSDGAPGIDIELLGDNYYVFSWDRYYIPQLKELGAPHVEYLPFAANPDIFNPIELNEEQRERFGCAVSFAGNSGAAEDNYRRACVAALDGLDVHVYGDPGWAGIQTKTIRYHGSLDNRTELPLLYNASALNLNLTASQLRTALPIRVFDVAAAGSLLISDYRVDLIDMFEDGREIICCRDMDALRETVETWLAEPEKRNQIGQAARARILQQHTFTHRIRKIIEAIPAFCSSLTTNESDII